MKSIYDCLYSLPVCLAQCIVESAINYSLVGQVLCMLFGLLILLGSGETRDESRDKEV